MSKRLFLYDVEEALQDRFLQLKDRDLLFSAAPKVQHCIGCFGCWIKTPGRCVIQDRCIVMPSYLAQCSEVIVVSPIVYGGYSPKIKAVLDRSIGYLLPYFRIVNHEMHHQMRYHNPFVFSVCFYGACGESEKNIARRLVKANAVNLGAGSCSIRFFPSAKEAVEELL